jgi:hypothetical protein
VDQHVPPPEADAIEQDQPADPEDATESRVTVNAHVPEPDALEQALPSGRPGGENHATYRRTPSSFVPEADEYEGALPADRDSLEDDER